MVVRIPLPSAPVGPAAPTAPVAPTAPGEALPPKATAAVLLDPAPPKANRAVFKLGANPCAGWECRNRLNALEEIAKKD